MVELGNSSEQMFWAAQLNISVSGKQRTRRIRAEVSEWAGFYVWYHEPPGCAEPAVSGTGAHHHRHVRCSEGFKTKLCLWENQILQGNLGHFPCCQTVKSQISVFPWVCWKTPDTQQFTWWFVDFDVQKRRLKQLSNPLAVDMETLPANLQMELNELQCSTH